jgi:hypothetical protein
MSEDFITVVITPTELETMIASGKVIMADGTLHNDLGGLQGGGDGSYFHNSPAIQSDLLTGAYLRRSGGTVSGIIDMGNNSLLAVRSILFDLLNSDADLEGLLRWNADDGTLDIGTPGGGAIQIGHELGQRARNVDTVPLPNLTAVRIAGGSGNNAAIVRGSRSVGAIAITTDTSIGVNQLGRITSFGLVRGVNTSTWEENARLYLSDVDGVITDTPPATLGRNVLMGINVVQAVNDGVVLAYPINVPFLAEISGVRITNEQDGDVLTFNAATGFWINQAP